MNWITISWPMAIAACLTLALIHAQIALRLRGGPRTANVLFSLSALTVAATGGCELTLLRVDRLETYQHVMLWSFLPLSVMVSSLAWFTWAALGGRRILAVLVSGLMGLLLVANFLVPPEYRIRQATSLCFVETIGGVPITLARIKAGPLTLGELAAVLLLTVCLVDASLSTWRRGDRRRAVMLGGSILFSLLFSRGYALLVEAGLLNTPFFFVFPYLAILMAMGRELSMDIHRAFLLAGQLRESEQRTQLAARAASLGFWVWDLERDDIWADPGARSLFGVSQTEPVNFARFLATLDPTDREPVQREAARALQTGEDYEMEYRVQAEGGGDRWILARGRADPGWDGGPLLMRGVVQDVTERKRAQLDADQTRKELAHVTRVSTMGELSASLAHELNQPLTAILSNAQAARRFLAAPKPDLDEIRAILDDIVKDDKLAAEVIHRLRAMVQKQARVEPVAVQVHELIHDAERLLHGELVGRDVELVLRLPPDCPPALAAHVPIQQVLLNLMMNALDALDGAGPAPRLLTVETRVVDGRVRVSVSDNGPGLSDSLLPDIFRPFFTTKAKGLGMGLSVSRTIVESFGGRLWAESPAIVGGARFHFELPSA